MKAKIIVALLVTFLYTFSLLGCSNSKQQSNIYSGTVECSEYDVQTELGGYINKVFVEDSSQINKNDVIAKLDDKILKLNLKQCESTYKISKIKYEEAKNGSRKEQIHQAKANVDACKAKLDELLSGSRPEEITQAEVRLQQAQNSLQLALKTYNLRKKTLEDNKNLKKNAVSQQQLDQSQNMFDIAEAQLISAQNSVKVAEANLKLVKSGPTNQKIAIAKASLENAKAQYDLLINGNSTYTLNSLKTALEQAEVSTEIANYKLQKAYIKSPITGTVLKTLVKKGETVAPGSIIATIADLNDLWIKVYIQEKYYSNIALNQKVQIICDTINEPVNGEITYIASNAEFTAKNTETKEDRQKRVFEVKIKVLDHLAIIKPGMDLEVILWNMQ